MPGYSANKVDHLNRLSRIEGQIRGIARMVDEEKYCIDVLTQLAAASRALQSVALGLLEQHLEHCFAGDVGQHPDERQEKLREASDAIGRLVRS